MASINANFVGSGYLALKDAAGNAYAAGQLQDVTLEISSEIKKVMGDKKTAILTAEVGRSYKLKAKAAQLQTALVSAVLGGVAAAGSKWIATVAKTFAASAATIATTDVGSPAGWAFVADLGVTYQANGQPLKYNAGSLAASGEYHNTLGAYTSGSGEATLAAFITFIYSQTAGETVTADNEAIGLSNYFSVYLYEQTTQADGTVRKVGFYFPAVTLPNLSLGFKNTDFMAQDLDLEVHADATGKICEMFSV